jgi:two-component system, OmpR family, phosphate regulon response regulator PhoB
MSAKRILIVEDDRDLVASVKYNLDREGYSTRSAFSGQEALEVMRVEPYPDLVLLDIMLPDISGIEICRRLRAAQPTASVPVIMVTAKSEEIDRVLGFEVGANDYVTKPFSMRELLLRVRAVIRRSQPTEAKASLVDFGRLHLDAESHRVWIDNEEVMLTALEFKLLLELLERRGCVESRETLLEKVWSADGESTTRTVDTHIMRLRRKLGAMGEYIETLRGVGYRLRDVST